MSMLLLHKQQQQQQIIELVVRFYYYLLCELFRVVSFRRLCRRADARVRCCARLLVAVCKY